MPMTEEEAAFHQAIIERPDDDVSRLVYADWLEEHGDPRAAFIRVQIELERLPPGDSRRTELRERERQLLAQHGSAWTEPLRGLVQSWKFRRGFVEQVTLPAEAFPDRAETLFRLAPLRHLRFRNAAPHLADLAGSPYLARLATLDLRDQALDDQAIEVLTASPHLAPLTTLHLGYNLLGDAGVHFLAGAPHLAALETLDLYANQIGVQGAQALATSPHLTGLRTLILGSNELGDEGVRELTAGTSLARLTTLHLSFNEVAGAGVRALAGDSALKALAALDLSYNAINDRGALLLATSPHLGRLARLALRGMTLSPRTRKTLQTRFGSKVAW